MLTYAVNSVLQQTYTDFELIICDDGSTDNTPDVVSQWQDPRIRYIRHPVNIKRSRNMRSGFEAASGTYFIKFDDDDALTPEFLQKTVAVLDSIPQADFVCTNHWIINAKGERDEAATQANSAKWGKDKLKAGLIPDFLTEAFQLQSLQVGSTLFRKSALDEVDFMRPEADGCEDFDLFVRLAIAGKQGAFLPELLMEYRIHGGQNSLKQDIHFLSAKLFCLGSYKFDRPELEQSRLQKMAGLKRVLAMRLIEKGDTDRGRTLLQESNQTLGSSPRATIGLVLSYLPQGLRQWAFQSLRQFRPKDYSQRVREAV
jgi:glycosyltransferase involved in cell wall biosynthesis